MHLFLFMKILAFGGMFFENVLTKCRKQKIKGPIKMCLRPTNGSRPSVWEPVSIQQSAPQIIVYI